MPSISNDFCINTPFKSNNNGIIIKVMFCNNLNSNFFQYDIECNVPTNISDISYEILSDFKNKIDSN